MYRFGDRCFYVVFIKFGNFGKFGLEGRESLFIQFSFLFSVYFFFVVLIYVQDIVVVVGIGIMNSDSWNEGVVFFFFTLQLGVNSIGLLGQFFGVEDIGFFFVLAFLGYVVVRGFQEIDFEMEISMSDLYLWKRVYVGWSRGRSWL